MVIECPSCKAKFRLPDEKVGPAGVSVRCSKCASTFAVHPPPAPAPVPPLAPTAVPGFAGVSPAFDAGLVASGSSSPAPPSGAGTPFAGLGLEPPGAVPASTRPVSSAPIDDRATQAGAFDGGMDLPPAIDPSLRVALLAANAPGSSLSGDDPDLAGVVDDAGGAARGAFDFGNDPFPPPAPGPRPAPPPAELFADRGASVPLPPTGAGTPEAAPGTPPPKRPLPKGNPKKKKKLPAVRIDVPREPVRAYRLLIALFFLGAAASAWASLTGGTLDPGRLDRGRLSLLVAPPAVPEALSGLAITARRGEYVRTEPGKPRVYAAHGLAINTGGAPKGYLEVRGRLLDASGTTLAESVVPCGNSFRDDQLLGFRSGDELRRAYLPAGDGLSNVKVAAGEAVPCTVVFFAAPDPAKTASFELEIVSAKPAS